jgi:hypothetical protein
MKRAIVTSVLAVAALQILATAALADSEWCDDGSPPPNDFRFRTTGTGSAGSSTAWLVSTSGGTLSFSPSYVNTLTGGVAHGMAEAIEHAGVKESAPAKP